MKDFIPEILPSLLIWVIIIGVAKVLVFLGSLVPWLTYIVLFVIILLVRTIIKGIQRTVDKG